MPSDKTNWQGSNQPDIEVFSIAGTAAAAEDTESHCGSPRHIPMATA
jgi:hypothetical protein